MELLEYSKKLRQQELKHLQDMVKKHEEDPDMKRLEEKLDEFERQPPPPDYVAETRAFIEDIESQRKQAHERQAEQELASNKVTVVPDSQQAVPETQLLSPVRLQQDVPGDSAEHANVRRSTRRASSVQSTSSSGTLDFDRVAGQGKGGLAGPSRTLSQSPDLSFMGDDRGELTADDRGYEVALRIDNAWKYKNEFEAEIGDSLLKALLDCISGNQGRLRQWDTMQPTKQACILMKVIGKSNKGSFPDITHADEACQRCLGNRGAGRRVNPRPCAGLMQRDGKTYIAFLPLPRAMREGKQYTDLGYWIDGE